MPCGTALGKITMFFSFNLCYYLSGIVQANVSYKGYKIGQNSKTATIIEAAPAISCTGTTPEDDALLACLLDMYIIVLFTSGSCAPSFRLPNNFSLQFP